ncbi:methyltransferase [Luteolibacter arcticus]|uniref:Methyltransferase n=1 Tax=Luteolibacter arcticus TaxID=1581411 RepID=A0ABT3GDR3_9BACT|nr:methyltransferase [Luteolibacter arcticus]MCW1921760.1 methyltransferase [Luteolibacter arcticus]
MSAFLNQFPATDPGGILDLRDRQFAAELIATALLHLDLFTWLEANPGVTSAAIAEHFGIKERPTDVMLTLCRAYGFVAGDPNRVSLTPMGREHLVKGSPWFLGPYFVPVRDTPVVRGFLDVLRTGKPGNWQAKSDGKGWHESMLDPEFAREFTELMNSRGLVFGQALARELTPLLGPRRTLLDVGGGSGIYSSTLVAHHPQLRASVLEQSPVDVITRSEIARHGLEEKVEVITADMFANDWPQSEIILLSNVLHDWDFPEVRLLLERAAKALAPDGLLVIHDAFIRDDKSGPVAVAEYSALLMNITQGKCYTPMELGGVLTDLGFRVGLFHDTVAHRGFLHAMKGGSP